MPDCLSDPVTLVLADDHALFRAVVREFLSREAGLLVMAEADDGRAAFEAIQAHRPRVAVLDVEMPGWTGLEVARAARSMGLPTTIVLLTIHKEPHIVLSARESGIAGYVLKDDIDADLIPAIRAAAGRGTYFSPRLASPPPRLHEG